MMSDQVRRGSCVAVILGAAVLAAGCTASTSPSSTTSTSPSTTSGGSGPTTTAGGPPVSAPGVTASQITIGAITTRTGNLAGYFDGLTPGMIAYFDMINAAGGVSGHKLVL